MIAIAKSKSKKANFDLDAYDALLDDMLSGIQEHIAEDTSCNHYCLIKLYKVRVDSNYRPIDCNCKAYEYTPGTGKNKDWCKHMAAVMRLYRFHNDINLLRSQEHNPLISIVRTGVGRIQVRWNETSYDEKKAYEREMCNQIFDYNYNN